MSIVSSIPIRLALSTVSRPTDPLIDATTQDLVKLFTAQNIDFEIAVFDGNDAIVDLSSLQYLQLIISDSQAAGSTLRTIKTVQAVDITNLITKAGWLDGSEQQAIFSLSDDNTNVPMADLLNKKFWLTIKGVTTDNKPIIFAANYIIFIQSGSLTTVTLEAGIDVSVTSWSALAAVPTVDVTVPAAKQWIDSVTNILITTLLKSGSDVTDVASGIQRPNDFNSGTNQKVWYKVG